MTDADRARLDDLAARLDRLADAGPPAGPCVAEVVEEEDLPTVADRWYVLGVVVVSGDEEEGEPAVFTATGAEIRAFNIGKGVPEVGGRFLCVPVDGRFVFLCP